MFDRILVPVDGSLYSLKAVKTAASLAEKFGSRVTLLYVVQIPARNPHYIVELAAISDSVIQDLEREGQAVLEKASVEFKDTAVSKAVRFGHPAGEILDEAQNNYDLIIIGSRGLGELKGFLLGSVSDRVSHHASCSVMIVH